LGKERQVVASLGVAGIVIALGTGVLNQLSSKQCNVNYGDCLDMYLRHHLSDAITFGLLATSVGFLFTKGPWTDQAIALGSGLSLSPSALAGLFVLGLIAAATLFVAGAPLLEVIAALFGPIGLLAVINQRSPGLLGVVMDLFGHSGVRRNPLLATLIFLTAVALIGSALAAGALLIARSNPGQVAGFLAWVTIGWPVLTVLLLASVETPTTDSSV
jgi:hypothetical protein